MKIPGRQNVESRRLTLPSLKGQGDAWEAGVAEHFPKHSETYRPPTADEMKSMEQAVRLLRTGLSSGRTEMIEQARRLAEPLGYELAEVEAGRQQYLLLSEGKSEKGWGLVLFKKEPPVNHLVIEAPHPVADKHTPELALQAFEQLPAGVYIMAGAHRSNSAQPSPDVKGRLAADMTHTRNTMFQAFHRGATELGDDVLQIHGFSAEKGHKETPDFPLDQKIVLTDGADDGRNPTRLTMLCDALREKGLRTDIVSFEDQAKSRLSAVTNVQRDDMEERGLVPRGEFVHLEADTSLRYGPDRQQSFDQIVDALGRVWNVPSS